MRAHHAHLFAARMGPVGSGVRECDAFQRDVVAPRFKGIKACRADDQFRHGDFGGALERRHDRSPRAPAENEGRAAGSQFRDAFRAGEDLFAQQLQRLAVLQKPCAEMLFPPWLEPPAGDEIRERIEPAERIVRHMRLPEAVSSFLPAAHGIGSGHDDLLALRGPIDNRRARASRVRGLHPFAVNAAAYGHDVTGGRDVRRALDRAPRLRGGTLRRVVAIRCHEILPRRCKERRKHTCRDRRGRYYFARLHFRYSIFKLLYHNKTLPPLPPCIIPLRPNVCIQVLYHK